ncbi:hypothetical protein R3P38DRAFT_2831861 [Favolaschia claudopus]|uniref:Uncharacterized protein n=1 Tax=Favolaschia claudopus TaxID=2862362 RepID=A0AAW0ECI4_9AGAR
MSPVHFPSRPATTDKLSADPPSLTHLVDKLDTLAKFYQRQLDWIDSSSSNTSVQVNVVETATESEDDDLSETETPRRRPASRQLASGALHRMRWRKQMKSLENKLSGKARKLRRGRITSNLPRRKASEEDICTHYILGMFGQIIGARMESCRRVQKLAAFHKLEDKRTLSRSPDQPGREERQVVG